MHAWASYECLYTATKIQTQKHVLVSIFIGPSLSASLERGGDSRTLSPDQRIGGVLWKLLEFDRKFVVLGASMSCFTGSIGTTI